MNKASSKGSAYCGGNGGNKNDGAVADTDADADTHTDTNADDRGD